MIPIAPMSDMANKPLRRTLRMVACATNAGMLVSFGGALGRCDNTHVVFSCEAE
jgi:hypothetical protein